MGLAKDGERSYSSKVFAVNDQTALSGFRPKGRCFFGKTEPFWYGICHAGAGEKSKHDVAQSTGYALIGVRYHFL
jgi:hypothetical protein